ncbi:hypothetical protein KUH03_22090 [Sphingobacterium sp. E70]|uniref:hypothetical protein n=1 Tax=Sphingobacterium sp. E70 TaxID=2853439 RepID=UPI00211B8532|nr:hypothetical protein [Sphingobacterium sp. E70]ULT22172.1 hypothetical protein KUH03_22090 [Sphingobacterium sp. E70]
MVEKGEIIVNFTIGKDGLPNQIHAEGTPEQALVDEAIRLLQSGVNGRERKAA